jgi:hypothetical protein
VLRHRAPRLGRACFLLVAGTVAGALAPAAGCGRKAAPRPPDLVRPRTVEDFSARAGPEGIRLTWTRPTETVDGADMPDLDGFVVERAEEASPDSAETPPLVFATVATIHLDDRERFSRIRVVRYDDRTVTAGRTYAYRVVAFTLVGYTSRPSRVVRARWPGATGPAPEPPAASAVE